MARKYLRREGQDNYSASAQGRIQLSRNYHVRYLLCKLTVNHTNSTAVFKSDHFANLINSVQIVANGNKTIKHVDVKKLIANAVYDQGKPMKSVLQTADGAKKSELYFTIDFSKRGMVRPNDTIENSSLYTTFDMLIDWANEAAVGTGVKIDSATLEVSSNQFVGYTRNPGERIAHNVETQLTEEITSSTTEYQISLPVKKIYQKLLIGSFIDGNRANTIINGVKLKSGTTVFADWRADDLKADNLDRYGIAVESTVDGMLLLDLVDRGRNSDALDTRGEFNTLELVLDVTKQTGTNTVTVWTDEFDVEQSVEVKG
jgi:hypothetical protein